LIASSLIFGNIVAMKDKRFSAVKWFFIAFLVLIINSGYLAAFVEPTIFYMINVLLHVVLGLALVIPFFIFAGRYLQNDAPIGKEVSRYTGKLGYWCFSVCIFAGLFLTFAGALRSNQWILHFHIIAGLLGVAFFQKSIRHMAHKISIKNPFDTAGRWALVVMVIAVGVPIFAAVYRFAFFEANEEIVNPEAPPMTMADQAMHGAEGPFFPSAVATSTQEKISPRFLLHSESCGRSGCHTEIYEQWKGSAHRYSSLNNPWYHQSLAHLQQTFDSLATASDTSHAIMKANPVKWCAGCHDPALLVSGMLERPLSELSETPEAHAGIACTACHSITQVQSTMGQGHYVIESTPLLEWENSPSPALRRLYDFLLRIEPAPHRQAMLKPFHRNSPAEFCSACHKAHLDVPVNQFRWVRSSNEYDAWHASAISGLGGRSFYSPSQPQTCVDCHMPLVESRDAGNVNGKIHSHRFPGANTALPAVNHDHVHLHTITSFLRKDHLTVDIFAIGAPYDGTQFYTPQDDSNGSTIPGDAKFQEERFHKPLWAGESMLSPATLFAVGEKQRKSYGMEGVTRHASNVIAPLTQSNATVRRGEEVRIDVVVRSRNVGHFFPSGTVDAHEVWLELKAFDDLGKSLFWSGAVANEEKGAVEPGAHFYRSYLLDSQGNHLYKNDIWAAREVVHLNLIPAGGVDVAHYRLRVPADCGEKIYLQAALNYRKFNWEYTQWVFGRQRDPNPHHFDFSTNSSRGPALLIDKLDDLVSTIPAVPDLPIVAMAKDEATLSVIDSTAEKPAPMIQSGERDWERWNDYGIGLLSQGDLQGAEAAFLKVTELAPDYADAWVNIGVTRLQNGRIGGVRSVLEKAMQINPDLVRARYFYGVLLKAQGKYDTALAHLKKVLKKFPRDRVVRNERGHLYLLMKDYERAIKDFQKVLTIDPENLEAHYFLMHAYRAMGEVENAEKAEAFYHRFKANPSLSSANHAPSIHQEAWRERQPIHEHFSAPLPVEADTTSQAVTDGKAQSANHR
jgi:tetratricopeptide (TPR) repeat protein